MTVSASGIVLSGGMSINSSITDIPAYRKPKRHSGFHKTNEVLALDTVQLGPRLVCPSSPGHHEVRPPTGTTLQQYEADLCTTKSHWRIVP